MELVRGMSAESTGTASVQPSKYRPQAGDKRFGRSTVTNHKDLLPQLDGRTGAARRFRDLVNAFIVDMGGLENCSEIKLGLLRRLAATTVQAERLRSAHDQRRGGRCAHALHAGLDDGTAQSAART